MKFDRKKLFDALYTVALSITHNFEKTEKSKDVCYFWRCLFDGVLPATSGFLIYNLPNALRGEYSPNSLFTGVATYIGQSFPEIASTITPATNIIGPIMMACGLGVIAASATAPLAIKYINQ